jgi:hypothetical protein
MGNFWKMLGNKLAPKNQKICKGCPPKDIEPVVTPKFNLGTPVKKDTSKVVSLVNMNDYRTGASRKKNSLF